jgi:hypothetical protein
VAHIADLYNDVLHPNAQVPEEWRTTRLSVLFKKRDSQMFDNYKPYLFTSDTIEILQQCTLFANGDQVKPESGV